MAKSYYNRSNRKGKVYLAKTPLYPYDLKIGFTEKRNPLDRVKNFNTGLKLKHHYKILDWVPVDRCYYSEQKLFRILRKNGYAKTKGKEFFRIYPWQVKTVKYYMRKYISNKVTHNNISLWHKYHWNFIIGAILIFILSYVY
tara:strand:+ start:60 stop:485 length:426 start_codon:yes stop_codon:yes gene_type:complete